MQWTVTFAAGFFARSNELMAKQSLGMASLLALLSKEPHWNQWGPLECTDLYCNFTQTNPIKTKNYPTLVLLRLLII